MSTDLWLDFLGIRVDSRKAEGMKFTINLVTPDNAEEFAVELNNSTLTNIKGRQAKNPDLTITINRSDLEAVMAGKATFDEQIATGKAKLTGDRRPFDQLKSLLVQFTPDFEMMPGTKPAAPAAPVARDPFEQDPPALTDGG
jgi:alkyl sulfatase BDS1-like metallo-beta-lactamase superfamily hydrolase